MDHPLTELLSKFKRSFHKRTYRNWELDKWERFINRLISHSSECKQCEQTLLELEPHFNQIDDSLDEETVQHNRVKLRETQSHLENEHKLVQDGTYLSLYLPIGAGIGFIIGNFLLDSIVIGLIFGAGVGTFIGTSLDAKAKKKGLTY